MNHKKPIGLDWMLFKKLCTKVLPMLMLFGLVSCSESTPAPETTVTPQTSIVKSKEITPPSNSIIGVNRDGTTIERNEPQKNIIHTQDNRALSVDKATYERTKTGDSVTSGTKP